LSYIWPQTPAICQLGWFVGDGYIDTMTIRVAWASFERHILIFHVTLIIIYCPFYYLIVEGFPPCKNTESWCSSFCLYQNKILVIHDILATILVVMFSISLIIRVIYHHRHRKIIIIFLSISAIYLLFNLPMMILKLVQLCGLSENIVERLQPYFDFLNYFVFILYPFICLGTMPKKFSSQRQRRLIGPTAFVVSNRQVIKKQYYNVKVLFPEYKYPGCIDYQQRLNFFVYISVTFEQKITELIR
jgi:hypothetical protein